MKLVSKQRNGEQPPLFLCILNSEGGMNHRVILNYYCKESSSVIKSLQTNKRVYL